MEKQLEVIPGTANAVGIKETSEFISFIATVAGIIAKNAMQKGSFLSVARDLVMTVFEAQSAIQGFGQIEIELKDLTSAEREQLEAAVRGAIVRQIGVTSKVDAVAGSLTVAAVSIYQSIVALKSQNVV